MSECIYYLNLTVMVIVFLLIPLIYWTYLLKSYSINYYKGGKKSMPRYSFGGFGIISFVVSIVMIGICSIAVGIISQFTLKFIIYFSTIILVSHFMTNVELLKRELIEEKITIKQFLLSVWREI